MEVPTARRHTPAGGPQGNGDRAADVRVLGAGDWSRAYSLVLDGREAVIRFGRHGEDFRKDQVMAPHNSPASPIPQIIEIGTGRILTSAWAPSPTTPTASPGMTSPSAQDKPPTRSRRHRHDDESKPGSTCRAARAPRSSGAAHLEAKAGTMPKRRRNCWER
jgi:hypothetical protein